MSKRIKLLGEELENVKKMFEAFLSNPIVNEGKLTLEQKFEDKRTANLIFTADAFCKMRGIVNSYSSEIAWHGLCKRHESQEDTYIIYDILVYPQEVTGATVNTDQVQYQNWLDEQPDDIFNNIRFQGHSHVNMATSPSSVDIGHQNALIDNLNQDDFYVFVIWNKRGEHWTKIVDLKTNRCFVNSEVTIDIFTSDGQSVTDFVDGTKTLVSPKTYPSYNVQSIQKVSKPSDIKTEKQTAIAALQYGGYSDDDFDYGRYGGSYY